MILSALLSSTTGHAELVLSQVIVDMAADKPPTEDIEVWNDSAERMYVQAEPAEILHAGTAEEQRIAAGDPGAAGLLVSPRRLILAPGERRTVRVASVGTRSTSDRVYRVAIRPVTGPVSVETTAIKVLVGYDVLVIVRPETRTGEVIGERRGHTLVLRNESNTSQEIFAGRQCNADGTDCRALPAKRLYPGNSWEQTLPFPTSVRYSVSSGAAMTTRDF
ncbi:hypothetical protein [Tsuneonella sp. SYSU-LHT278]|uniref:hypothetical protein n=1 Tax=Tsuneonella sediminis TaxID=3416089 RepID=UPI003F7AE0DF